MTSSVDRFAQIELDVPLQGPFDYRLPAGMHVAVGARVVVPWGRVRRVGLVRGLSDRSALASERVRDIESVLDHSPMLDEHWWRLVRFAADYYHRAAGEIGLAALPRLLRAVPARRARGVLTERLRARWDVMHPRAGADGSDEQTALPPAAERRGPAAAAAPTLLPAQREAVDALCAASGFVPFLLHGATGSGKTEVYLRWFETLLARPGAQALLLVPEIALTPQLVRQVEQRFAAAGVAVLHSALPDVERAAHWLAAAEARARIVVGTRLAVLAALPQLAGIVVDEEHDPSYKQHEGAQYSARDLAIVLARQHGVPVVLGSATPSIETWRAAGAGRYRLLSLPERATGAPPPRVRLITLPRGPLPGGFGQAAPASGGMQHGLMPQSIEAIGGCLARREQALVFLNRRGYAPVLSCTTCGWLSGCEACSAWRVLHRVADAASPAEPGAGAPRRARYRLACHHCGLEGPVPRACPDCGNVDLAALGRGTQRIEEGLQALFPQARIGRVDRDVARRRGAAQAVIDSAHAGETDILVGTQMLAKGHDFARLTRVIVADADSGLFAADFRAPERMFATLMQVAGRAGRSGLDSEVLVQTRYPDHPLFEALVHHDYQRFAHHQLRERHDAALPPFVHQALLRADAASVAQALELLGQARTIARMLAGDLPDTAVAGARTPAAGVVGSAAPADRSAPVVTVYDAVPMPLVRLAHRERAQLLIESPSRRALHALLDALLPRLRAIRSTVRWQLEIDPIEI